MISPKALAPGDRVRVVAPSGPFDRSLVLRGMAWLGERYQVEFDQGAFERQGFLAGSDERRLAELNSALGEPELGAVIAARGGYGLTRIAHRVDWASLRTHPKWLVGFSDATALHVEAARIGIASLHADNVGGLGRDNVLARGRWVEAIENPERRREFPGLRGFRPGQVSGPLFGGNLTMLFACAAARRLAIPDGAILVLEDVSEAAYRIDRMLTALVVSGVLDHVAGVIIGDFVDCALSYETSAEQVLRERLDQLRVPIVGGFPLGHGPNNHPLPLGLTAQIDGLHGSVIVCP